jgi:hypothetical protein
LLDDERKGNYDRRVPELPVAEFAFPVAAWREAHERFWGSYTDEQITDETLIVAERFRLVDQAEFTA